MLNIFYHTGRYFLLLKRVFSRPERGRVFLRQTVRETINMGISSIGIVLIISMFMGAVCAIQMAYNLQNPIIPRYLIGLGTRETLLLEFSSTIVALILAGKVGSNIASELGTMRVTEQIDALEMMGVNSACYLILPKITAFVFFIPVLTIFSMAIGLLGGYVASFGTVGLTPHDYVVGITSFFKPFYVTYSLIKSLFFAFIIASVSSYHGYYAGGGALEVGKASTHAVVHSSIIVLLFNLILTKLLL
ncbi:MAG: ABC transporter permease [Bacteroidales bacterium]|nr:ABC transporter permease [Bacteroidales bacterium]MBR6279536.1 ABC transporter permease [Bacteroidales bacterium]MCR4558520.1 ABC transporter permease [Bacteroidales bacterium]